MAVIGCFIFGFDTDTTNIFQHTLHAIELLNIDVADFCILTPFPGTPLFNRLQQNNRLLTTDWSKYTLKNVVFNPKHMTPGELQQGVQQMYHDYYSPLKVLKRLVKSIRLGFFPFFSIFTRTFIATMNSRRLYEKP
jgi:radical SAM superfamily enzyme YgiQ (UPF0313 family)